jgi:rubrerythrin
MSNQDLNLDDQKQNTRRGKMDWITFLNVMIEDEKAAINKYRLALEQADSEKLKTVLKQLMHEEEIHVDFLEEEIRRLQAS